MSIVIVNDNEYDDDAYTQHTAEVDQAIGSLWFSGAAIDDIAEIVANAISNAADEKVRVEISAR